MSDKTRAVDLKDEGKDVTFSCSSSQEIESLSAMSEETCGVDVKDGGADGSSFLSYSQDIESLSDQTGDGSEGEEGIALQSPRYSSNRSDHNNEHEEVEPSWWWSPQHLKHLLSGVNLDNIFIGIPKVSSIVRCPKCNCYLQPPGTWIKAQVGSKQLMHVCLRSLKILKARLVNAQFVGTDPHRKSINVKLTLQKEVAATGVILERGYTVQFVIQDDMCESCSS